jgi:hypothetical protein
VAAIVVAVVAVAPVAVVAVASASDPLFDALERRGGLTIIHPRSYVANGEPRLAMRLLVNS